MAMHPGVGMRDDLLVRVLMQVTPAEAATLPAAAIQEACRIGGRRLREEIATIAPT